MSSAARQMVVWYTIGGKPLLPALELAERVAQQGGAGALPAWRNAWPDRRLAYVHGGRHDLWWEFRVFDSFRWQAQVYRLAPDLWRRRMQRLCTALGIDPLLDRRVEELTASERALADLAVALLPRPEVLLWEEPLAVLSDRDGQSAIDLVRELTRTDGLVVVATAAEAPGLAGFGARRVPSVRALS